MLKNVIAPVQAWLLAHGQCVGCGTLLAKGKITSHDKNTDKVVCRCGRIFMYEKPTSTYRRALFSEI